jgi:hypothetical protein
VDVALDVGGGVTVLLDVAEATEDSLLDVDDDLVKVTDGDNVISPLYDLPMDCDMVRSPVAVSDVVGVGLGVNVEDVSSVAVDDIARDAVALCSVENVREPENVGESGSEEVGEFVIVFRREELLNVGDSDTEAVNGTDFVAGNDRDDEGDSLDALLDERDGVKLKNALAVTLLLRETDLLIDAEALQDGEAENVRVRDFSLEGVGVGGGVTVCVLDEDRVRVLIDIDAEGVEDPLELSDLESFDDVTTYVQCVGESVTLTSRDGDRERDPLLDEERVLKAVSDADREKVRDRPVLVDVLLGVPPVIESERDLEGKSVAVRLLDAKKVTVGVGIPVKETDLTHVEVEVAEG